MMTDSTHKKASPPRSPADRIQRGKRVLFVTIAVMLVSSLFLLGFDFAEHKTLKATALIRTGVALLLYYFMARGYAWARYTVVVLGMVACAILGAYLMSATDTDTIIIASVFLVLYALVVIVLTFFRDIIHYEDSMRGRYQDRK